jgi:hypothetical protein
MDWSKVVRLQARILRANANTTDESIYRFTLGEADGSNTGDPAVASIGVKVVGGGAMQILAHDGTNLTTFSTSHTPSANSAFDLLLVSDGSGTVTAFVNGSSVGSTTGGPTTLLAGTANNRALHIKVENTSSFASSAQQYYTYASTVEIIP